MSTITNTALFRLSRPSLGLRLFTLGALLSLELVALTMAFDTASLPGTRLLRFVGDWGPELLRAFVTIAAIVAGFGYRTFARVAHQFRDLAAIPVSRRLAILHVCAASICAWLSVLVFSQAQVMLPPDFTAVLWLLCGLIAGISAVFALIPYALLSALARASGSVSLLAVAGGILSCFVGDLGHLLWRQSASITFWSVRQLLRPLIPGLLIDPERLVIGSSAFRVSIAPSCSGLEGVGLMLVFTAAWVWFFRREFRFPHVLLLIPVSMALVWMLNALRIALIILIGSSGHAAIAMGGFHSQAGWVGFNAVALAFSWSAGRISFLQPACRVRTVPKLAGNPAAPYLLPFMAILAAGILSRILMTGFDFLYPLRFIAAAVVIYCFRDQFRKMAWGVGWLAPATGIVVFALWLALDVSPGNDSGNSLASGLRTLSPVARGLWLTVRVLAAVVTVPFAEELAFRGFLFRTLLPVASTHAVTVCSVLLSSVLFGLMHGDRWIAGTIAGAMYSLVFLWRGRIGDAVVAHASTNALLAGWVIYAGQWHLW